MLISALQGVSLADSPWWPVILGVLGLVVGGGTIGKFLAKRLRAGHQAETIKVLSETFAGKSDISQLRDELNGLRGSLKSEMDGFRQSLEFDMRTCEQTATGAAALAETAITAADHATRTTERVEILQGEFQKSMMENVVAPMREMAKKQQEQGEVLFAQTRLLERLTTQVDRKL